MQNASESTGPCFNRKMGARRNLYGFALTSLFNDVASEMAYWILPAFVVSIGGGPAQLGVIEGIAEAMASFAKLASGYITDAVSRRKPIVLGGYVVANAVKPLLAISSAWWHVLAIRFADRTSKGIRGTARDVMLAESAKDEQLGSAYGFVQAADSAGAILGPLLAWILLRQAHWSVRNVFWAAAVPGVLCVLSIAFIVREPKRALPAKIGVNATRIGLPRAFWMIFAIVLLFSLGASSDMFLVLRAKERGIPVALAPLLGLVFNTVYTAGAWPAGWLSDRIPRHVVAAAGYAVYAGVYAVFALCESRTALWLAMATYGLYYALTEAVLKALVVSSVPREVRGRAVGIYSFGVSVCVLISSAATGFLWNRFGGAVPLAASAVLAAVAAGAMLVIEPTRTQRPTKTPRA